MSTLNKAYIKLKNSTNSRVLAQLYHTNTKQGNQSTSWIIDKNSTSSSPPLTVCFANNSDDKWFIVLHVVSGPDQGTYVSKKGSTIAAPNWTRADLQSGDVNATETFEVSLTTFSINLSSGTTDQTMYRLRDFQPIQNVFMLMLENRSYDHLLAFAGLSGKHATTSNYNLVDGVKYPVTKTAPTSMTNDPRHEFVDVLEQLCGPDAKTPNHNQGEYPTIQKPNDTGFALSYGGGEQVVRSNVDLNFVMAASSSPCITVPGGQVGSSLNFRMASAQLVDGTGLLRVDGDGYSYGGAGNPPQMGVAPSSSPSIVLSADMDSWVAAFVDPGTQYLKVMTAAQGGLPASWADIFTHPPVRDGTSPSLILFGATTDYLVAFQGAGGTLCLLQTGQGAPTDTGYRMRPDTSPSLAASPTPRSWLVAWQSDQGFLCLSSDGENAVRTDCQAASATSPCLAFAPDGSYAVAYASDVTRNLCVYDSTTGEAVEYQRTVLKYTSPSILLTEGGSWIVAMQSKGHALHVVDKDGATLLAGPTMRNGTSPSIAAYQGNGWVVAFQDETGAPQILDQNGTPINPVNISEVMSCFDTKKQLLVLYTLATSFQVCDHWYSSLPGPTWPNRLFAHCATSDGLDDSPAKKATAKHEYTTGYPMKSVFDVLPKTAWPNTSLKMSYRLYQDCQTSAGHIDKTMGKGTLPSAYAGAEAGFVVGGPVGAVAGLLVGGRIGAYATGSALGSDAFSYILPDQRCGGVEGCGWVPQVLALDGLSISEMHTLGRFQSDLNMPYDAAYTFVEPHYGNAADDSFKGGTSQHSRDSVLGGEALIKFVYETLRSSPLWYTSVLIVTYDEHGGFFDCVTPPGTAMPPERDPTSRSKFGFDFTQYGVRVPTLVISPMVSSGVSDMLYDHTSISRTLHDVFGTPTLTARDAVANSVMHLCSKSIAGGDIRMGCPATLPDPVGLAATAAPAPEEGAATAAPATAPLPESGNLIGFLQVLLKVAVELSDGSPEAIAALTAEYDALQTRADAAAFARKVWEARAARLSAPEPEAPLDEEA